MTNTTPVYYVNVYGSNPNQNEDNCWFGIEFNSREAAEAAYANPSSLCTWHKLTEGEYVEIDGPDVHKARPLKRGEWVRSKPTRNAEFEEAKWEYRMLYGHDYV